MCYISDGNRKSSPFTIEKHYIFPSFNFNIFLKPDILFLINYFEKSKPFKTTTLWISTYYAHGDKL